ncbi:MAG: radical SAM protein, partial [Pseudomonadota bacterium]
PYGRGNSRSVPAGAVIERIKGLVDQGYGEVVLTGADVTSYGPDLPGSPSLGQLIERVLKHVPELPRLRLSSLDSIEIDDRLFELIAHEPRLMPHLHLSLQAGDDMILKRMKRRHSRAQAVETVARLKAVRPEIAIGADIIAGFPTETEAMFANTLRLVEECPLTYLHVFPFSPRKGTPAARMPQIHGAVIARRAGELRAKGVAALKSHLEGAKGRRINVLMENEVQGRSADFTPVRLEAEEGAGALVDAVVAGDDGAALIAVRP